jgi:hypothetical protein
VIDFLMPLDHDDTDEVVLSQLISKASKTITSDQDEGRLDIHRMGDFVRTQGPPSGYEPENFTVM